MSLLPTATILLLLLATLAAQTGAQPQQPDPVCVPAKIAADTTPVLQNDKGQTVPRVLQNARAGGVMPERLPTSILLDLEGATYSWLFKQIFSLLGWSPCGLVPQAGGPFPFACLAQPGTGTFPAAIPWCAPTPAQQQQLGFYYFTNQLAALGQLATNVCTGCKATSYPTPEGWQLVDVLKVDASYAGQPAKVPVGAVLKPAAGNTEAKQLVVVLRGAAFNGDSKYSDDYAQVDAAVYGAGAIHKGYKSMADQIWPAVAAAVDAEIVNGAAGSITDILLGGHSVGGGLGMLLSTRLQSYLATQCAPASGKCAGFPSPTNPKISLVAFGSVNVGNTAYAADFNARVNARIVDFEKDRTQQFLLTRFPTGLLLGTVAPVTLATPYARVSGAINITAEDMPFQPAVWGAITDPGASLTWPQNEQVFLVFGSQPVKISQTSGTPGTYLQNPRAQVYTLASHICAYDCKLSSYLKQTAAGPTGSKCLLAADAQLEASASYCGELPPYAFAKVFPLQDTPSLFP